jgi:precorrin-6B methylase 2
MPDAGCGTGALTSELLLRTKTANIVGGDKNCATWQIVNENPSSNWAEHTTAKRVLARRACQTLAPTLSLKR